MNIDVKIAKHHLEQSVGEELGVPAGLHAVVVSADEDAAGVGRHHHGLHRSWHDSVLLLVLLLLCLSQSVTEDQLLSRSSRPPPDMQLGLPHPTRGQSSHLVIASVSDVYQNKDLNTQTVS